MNITLTKPTEALGVDLGNTVFDQKKQLFPDVVRVLRRLVTERFGNEVYIISKVTPEQKKRALQRIEDTQFHLITGIRPQHVEFCAERADKAAICARLNITHHIDDRPEVMRHLEHRITKFLFQPIPEDLLTHRVELQNTIVVQSWIEIEKYLCRADGAD